MKTNCTKAEPYPKLISSIYSPSDGEAKGFPPLVAESLKTLATAVQVTPAAVADSPKPPELLRLIRLATDSVNLVLLGARAFPSPHAPQVLLRLHRRWRERLEEAEVAFREGMIRLLREPKKRAPQKALYALYDRYLSLINESGNTLTLLQRSLER